MKKLAFLLGFVLLGTSAISEQDFQVDPENFDGSKLLQRYSALKLADFRAEIRSGKMWIVFRDGAPIPATPIFESSDTTKRDRLTVLRGNLRSRDLNLAELNEYMRLTAGL